MGPHMERFWHYIDGAMAESWRFEFKNTQFPRHFQVSLLAIGFLWFVSVFTPKVVRAEFGSIVDVGLAGDLFFTDESANNGQGFVNLLIQNTWSESQIWFDVGAGGLVGDTASSYVKAPQFFYRMGAEDRPHLVLGRSLHSWSFLDEYWNLGITQPIFRWNEAMPEEQGLTGLFLNFPIAEKKLQATFFASYLFLPTQGPSYELINGNLTSSNPWFAPPVEVINFANERAEVNYAIDIPKTQNIVFRPSYGVQFGTQKNKKNLQINTFYMDKPKNDLLLPFQGELNLSTFSGDVTVKPQVARHHIVGADIGWNSEIFKSVLSWVHESASVYDAPANTTFPVLPHQDIIAANQLFRLSSTQRLTLGYIKVFREANQIGGVFANAQISSYLNRNRFEEAFQVKWEGLLFKSLNLYRIQTTLAYNQSLLRDNVWISADMRWSIYRGFEAYTHCDFFGGSDGTILNYDFMSAYQNNDRCLVGGHYAF